MTNPVSGGFQLTPATGLNDTVTYPSTPVSETTARQQFMDMYWQLMNEMNLPTLSASAYAQYNKLINGNFDVWQRGTSFAADGYTADRWNNLNFADGGTLPTLTRSRQQFPGGFLDKAYFYYTVNTNGAGTTLGTNSYGILRQPIENGTRSLCGAGKKITVSFYARSSIAGKKLGVTMSQNYGSGGSPSAADPLTGTNVTLTSSFTKYTFTFSTATLSGKTFGSNNDDSLVLDFYYAWGSLRQGYVGASTSETFGGSGTIDISQVQVNAGDQALPFQPRSFAEELSLCQRYYEKSYDYGTTPASVSTNGAFSFRTGGAIPATTAGTLYAGSSMFKAKKRTAPTMTLYSPNGTSSAVRVGGSTNRTGCTASTAGDNGIYGISVDNTSSTVINLNDLIDFHWTADSEI